MGCIGKNAMNSNRLPAKEVMARILLAFLFTIMAATILLVFSPWRSTPRLGFVEDHLAKIGVSIVLLVAALLSRRSERFKRYWQVLFALFILTVAISLDWITAVYVRSSLSVNDSTPAGWALQKLSEWIIIASVIVTLTLAAGGNLSSIYLQKGNLKLGLIIGSISIFIFAAGAIPMAALFNAPSLSLSGILPWLPWLLVFVFTNGTLEELLFRGMFLRKLEPLVGKYVSIFLLAFIFTGLHSWVSYNADNRIFIAVTFPLAGALGFIM
jgi:membrane protease YdiL (CAAX protease family)